jgi:hypothetical protein
MTSHLDGPGIRFWRAFVQATRLLAVVVLLAGCGAATTNPVPMTTPTSTAMVAPPSPSLAPDVGMFAGLPYTMKLPDGWFGGGPDTFADQLRAFESSNPELARIVKEMSPPVGDVFVAVSPNGGASLSVNTLAAGPGWSSDAEILDESERQNLEGIASLPGTVGKPQADRVTLRSGDAVRIRWTSRATNPQDGSAGELLSVGYALTDGVTIFVVVFSYDGSPERLAEVEQIMDSLELRP